MPGAPARDFLGNDRHDNSRRPWIHSTVPLLRGHCGVHGRLAVNTRTASLRAWAGTGMQPKHAGVNSAVSVSPSCKLPCLVDKGRWPGRCFCGGGGRGFGEAMVLGLGMAGGGGGCLRGRSLGTKKGLLQNITFPHWKRFGVEGLGGGGGGAELH